MNRYHLFVDGQYYAAKLRNRSELDIDPWTNQPSAVLATNFFGGSFDEWFGSVGASMFSLFQIMTLESWSMGIVRPVMVEFPHAWAFFVPFILVTSFAVINLFIGVIVDAMQTQHAEEARHVEARMDEDTASLRREMAGLREEIAGLRRSLQGSG